MRRGSCQKPKTLVPSAFQAQKPIYDSYEGIGRLKARSIHSFWQQLSYIVLLIKDETVTIALNVGAIRESPLQKCLIFIGSLGSMVAKRSILNDNSRVPALSSQLFGIICNLSTLSPREPLYLK